MPEPKLMIGRTARLEKLVDTKLSFLDLPAELRNEIYRLAILRNTSFVLTKKCIEEPALLKTCK